MNPFDLLTEFLSARVRRPERAPEPDARRADFPRGADAVPDRKRTPVPVAVSLVLAVAALAVILLICML